MITNQRSEKPQTIHVAGIGGPNLHSVNGNALFNKIGLLNCAQTTI